MIALDEGHILLPHHPAQHGDSTIAEAVNHIPDYIQMI